MPFEQLSIAIFNYEYKLNVLTQMVIYGHGFDLLPVLWITLFACVSLTLFYVWVVCPCF